MIDPKIGEALAEFESRISFLEMLHAPSNNPTNLEERVVALEEQLAKLGLSVKSEPPKKESYTIK